MDNSEEENMSEAHNLETRTSIESLPDDVVFDILARVPAHDIYSSAKLVCHKWYQTIRTHDFVRAHLHQSACGLAFHHNYSDPRNKTLMFATPKGIEISNYKFTGDALSSCNGLVLERQQNKKTFFRITNPATNQHLDLPVFTPGVAFYYESEIAYAVASKEYKVVCPFHSNFGGVGCAILTVGVDEDWKRRVDIRHLSPSAKDLLLTPNPPSTTDGFVHWADARHSKYVVTLNVETEIITQFPAVPPSFCAGSETKLCYSYLPMGSCLSLLIAREKEPFPKWDQVWVMKPETGEWTKMMSIDSESLHRAIQGVSDLSLKFYPVGWLKFREVLVFESLSWSSATQICIAYNVRTNEIEPSFELDFIPLRFVVHRNSLVWLD